MSCFLDSPSHSLKGIGFFLSLFFLSFFSLFSFSFFSDLSPFPIGFYSFLNKFHFEGVLQTKRELLDQKEGRKKGFCQCICSLLFLIKIYLFFPFFSLLPTGFFLEEIRATSIMNTFFFFFLFFEVCFHLFLSFQAFLTSPFLFLFPTEFIQYLKGFGASYYYHIIINMTIIIDLAELVLFLPFVPFFGWPIGLFFFFFENGWFVISSLSCLLSPFHFPPLFFSFPFFF